MMKKVRLLFALCCMLCGTTLFSAPPSYLILIQQDTMKNGFNAAFAPSWELKKELDKLGFVGGMTAVNGKLTLEVLKQYNVVIIGVGQSDFKLNLPEAADRLDAMLTVADTRPGRRLIEAHNPTVKAIKAVIRPAGGFTLLGDFSREVIVQPGRSVKIHLK